jgi:hypothetical protein
MQLLSTAAQQTGVGSVADERMLELIDRGGRGAALKDKTGLASRLSATVRSLSPGLATGANNW